MPDRRGRLVRLSRELADRSARNVWLHRPDGSRLELGPMLAARAFHAAMGGEPSPLSPRAQAFLAGAIADGRSDVELLLINPTNPAEE